MYPKWFNKLWPSKPTYEIPWYNGYIDFPEKVDEICIAMRNGQVLRINNPRLTIRVEEHSGFYMAQRVIDIQLKED